MTNDYASFTFKESDNYRPYEREVARGIELLDEKLPDWRNHINWSTLDMSSSVLCIGGQAFASLYGTKWVMPHTPFSFAMKELGMPVKWNTPVEHELARHGFMQYPHNGPEEDGYDGWTEEVLTEEWVRQGKEQT